MSFHGPAESEALHKKLKDADIGPLSEADDYAVREKMRALDQFFSKRLKARYKIEVQFGKNRSAQKPFSGALSLFLSGTKIHGGGDEKLYLCPRADCGKIIYPNERLGANVMCRSCEMMWDEKALIGELLFVLTTQKWAEVILRYFALLDHNADIYLKYHPTDIRYKTTMELARDRGGEALSVARKNRGLHIYPLKNIITDTSAGADLYARLLAFIRA